MNNKIHGVGNKKIHLFNKMIAAFNIFPISERKEFLNALGSVEIEKFIAKISKQAVTDFWTHERE